MEQKIKSIIARLDSSEIAFADVRITNTDYEAVGFENGSLKHYGNSAGSPAIGIRVLINGCFGFAGSKDLSEASVARLITKAKNNAIHGALFQKEKLSFPPLPASICEYIHQPQIDPFTMSKADKMDYLNKLANAIKPAGKIVHSYVMAEFERQEKYYANTEGSYSHTVVYNTLPVMGVISADSGQIQSRT
jgi:TldD protein